jgi:hypothetical protein
MSRGLRRIAACLLLRRRLTATTAATAFSRALVEFLATTAAATGILVLTLALLAAAAGILPLVQGAALRLRRTRAVARGKRDLEFVEFIPLGVGTVAVRYGQQFLHARPRGYGGILWRL